MSVSLLLQSSPLSPESEHRVIRLDFSVYMSSKGPLHKVTVSCDDVTL